MLSLIVAPRLDRGLDAKPDRNQPKVRNHRRGKKAGPERTSNRNPEDRPKPEILPKSNTPPRKTIPSYPPKKQGKHNKIINIGKAKQDNPTPNNVQIVQTKPPGSRWAAHLDNDAARPAKAKRGREGEYGVAKPPVPGER
jgi:hypothetical protein